MIPPVISFPHFIAHSDPLAQAILAILLLASLLGWSIIVDRLVGHGILLRRRRAYFEHYRKVQSADGLDKISTPPQSPYTRLLLVAIQARDHYLAHHTAELQHAGGLHGFLTRLLSQQVTAENQQLERGLTVLATIGSTAPFVGLLGTVLGIYHALATITISGHGTLDKVAGPVGEALIMTAIGLAVAIPAVLGYNLLVRLNRIVVGELARHAQEITILAVSGAPLNRSGQW
jgi:biopolymer transport protein ExbB